jgi:biopolymer transport protein TolR
MAMSVRDASGGDDGLQAEITVTPLVDVVLVLLVILLLVTPLLKEEIPVEVPVAADGSVALDGAPLPDDALAVRLTTIWQARPDKSVLVAADGRLPYARVVEVLDACRAAGIERIGMITAPPASSPTDPRAEERSGAILPPAERAGRAQRAGE